MKGSPFCFNVELVNGVTRPHKASTVHTTTHIYSSFFFSLLTHCFLQSSCCSQQWNVASLESHCFASLGTSGSLWLLPSMFFMIRCMRRCQVFGVPGRCACTVVPLIYGLKEAYFNLSRSPCKHISTSCLCRRMEQSHQYSLSPSSWVMLTIRGPQTGPHVYCHTNLQ